MPSLTAIELGADTCAMARTSVRRGEVRVFAAELLDPASFPGDDSFTVGVRQARRTAKLPRRARVVLWGLPEGSDRKDAAVKPLLLPLANAGFRVERVVSPCNALAALARVRAPRDEGATCWLAVNRGGVAIVVVRPGKQLYAHSFVWDSNVGASGSQARLLQRYSLVSFLSPEVKRAMDEARKQGAPVSVVVTCGNLPDLRSLTMPLIEELDVEVETLDSLDGLMVSPEASDKLAEIAPGIRLACAGAIARGTRPWDESKRRYVNRTSALLRAAALIAAIGALGYGWYRLRLPGAGSQPPATATPTSVPRPAPPVAVPPKTVAGPIIPPAKTGTAPISAPQVPAKTGTAPISAPPAATKMGKAVSLPPPPGPPKPTVSGTSAAKPPVVRAEAPTTTPVAVLAAQKTAAVPVLAAPPSKTAAPPVSGGGKTAAATPPPRPALPVSPAAPRIPTAPPPSREPAPAVNPPPVRADKPEAGLAPAAPLTAPSAPLVAPSAAPTEPMPALLKEPVPRITAILVANDRRFATVGEGQIIGVGDVLGRRIVLRIEENAVVLREPSGVQIRVGLGGRVLGVERGR